MPTRHLANLMNRFIAGDGQPLSDWLTLELQSNAPDRMICARYFGALASRFEMQPAIDWRDGYPLGHALGERQTLAPVNQPDWSRPLTESTAPLVLVGEQGIGDQIRWAHHLLSLDPDQIEACLVAKKLVPLMTDCFPQHSFRGIAERPSKASLQIKPDNPGQIAMGDIDGFDWDPIKRPQPSGFLTLSEGVLVKGRETLMTALAGHSTERPVVGLTFRSMMRDTFRNMHYSSAEDWAGFLAETDVTLVLLQYGFTDDEVEQLTSFAPDKVVVVPGLDLVDDILGLAGVIAHLDAMVGASTMSLDLASALGVPTWRVMPAIYNFIPSEGVFGHPWYGSACRLIPYATGADWSEVLAGVGRLMAHEGLAP